MKANQVYFVLCCTLLVPDIHKRKCTVAILVGASVFLNEGISPIINQPAEKVLRADSEILFLSPGSFF